MSLTFDTQIESFQEPDSEGILCDLNKITTVVIVDGAIVWTETVQTDDEIESVCGAQDELEWKAIEYAMAEHDYKPTEEQAESCGLLVSHA